MSPRTKEAGRHVEAVLRALDLLECFQAQPALSLKELVARSGLNRSRVMRLAGTLEARGYLSVEAESGRFRLGSRLLTLGKLFEEANTLLSLARPVLRRLVAETGESASLYAIDGSERVALAREHGTHEVRFSVTEGGRSVLQAGAAGKVLLAHAPAEVVGRVLRAGGVEAGRLARQLALVRRRGWAFSRGERVPDAWGLAAPVFGHDGAVTAAIGVAGPLHRLNPGLKALTLAAVTGAARELSEALGFAPGPAPKSTPR